MSNQTVRAEHDELRNIQQAFSNQASATTNTIKSLQSRMETLRGGDWIGQGATAFYQEMDSQVMPAMVRLEKALEEAKNFAQQVSALMKTAEDETSRLWAV
jgi:WXG100 family type VII secretion target